MSLDETQDLIINTFKEFRMVLRDMLKCQKTHPIVLSVNILPPFLEWERVLNNSSLRNELFQELDEEGYNYLLDKCSELANLYNLSTKNRLMGRGVDSVENNEQLNLHEPVQLSSPDVRTDFEYSEVNAPADGTIYKIRYWDDINSYGNFIIIEHDDGRYSLLGHLERSLSGVKEGQRIRQGDPIATGGSSGRGSVPPHLHWSVFESVDTFHSNAGDNGIFLGPGYVVNFAKTVNPQIFVDSGTYIHPSHGRITDIYGSTIITTGRPYHEGIDYSLKDKRK